MGKVIYLIRNKQLIINDTKIDITNMEAKLLEILINNELNTYEEMYRYVYGYNRINDDRSLSVLKNRLVKRTRIEIQTRIGFGYKLLTEVYIDR